MRFRMRGLAVGLAFAWTAAWGAAPAAPGPEVLEWLGRASQSPPAGSARAETEARVLRWLRRDRVRMIRLLARMVRQNSGSGNPRGLARVLAMMREELQPLGFDCRDVGESADGGPHLVCRREGAGRRILLIGHADTIFESDHPFQDFQVEGTRARGPGVRDMKGGLVILVRALAALHAEGRLDGRPLTVIVNGDEETGSLSSRPLIEAAARESAVGLVFEGSSNGVLTTARGGLGQGHFEIQGVSAHIASRRFTADANQELAEKVLRILHLNDTARGVHVNVAPIHGGIKRNQVSGSATGSLDLRFPTPEDGKRLLEQVREILSTAYVKNPAFGLETRTTFDVFLHRPPFEETPETRALAQVVLQAAREMGLERKTGASAGGSDQNLVAALGVPCLDSLGMSGKGAHTVNEQGDLESLVPAAQLSAVALLRLWSEDGAPGE